eukprot:CAMPEP_0114234030 /NCGR_PEP_ID=MMETSP0058-20121206/5497_1 /TAXON_ID=36894 /ORGANISM="Pyramimonas parkeae, CCMP726" /LENGTH=152 /DNA_ID=CAMNT_0001345693 /DNA_START=585 /DNA_END=1043 /DNA_ORIENTATION=-
MVHAQVRACSLGPRVAAWVLASAARLGAVRLAEPGVAVYGRGGASLPLAPAASAVAPAKLGASARFAGTPLALASVPSPVMHAKLALPALSKFLATLVLAVLPAAVVGTELLGGTASPQRRGEALGVQTTHPPAVSLAQLRPRLAHLQASVH